MDTLNIQLCPSPIFYLGGRSGLFHGAADTAAATASIVSAFAMNSTSYALAEGVPINTFFAHGLGHTPATLFFVLLCTTNDASTGLVAGQEVPAYGMGQATNYPPFGVVADATNIYVSNSGATGGFAGIFIPCFGQTINCTTVNNFSLKVYWQ